ncbi:hypothetical protein [Larkinella punicea]|uniref:Uncharacterized protein n=1 Tax=Larkinella punicea TaxID=2315727 RepID=A0A368JQ50_9BACT|nr:hypothetical protein [Larkinella punicea]RCR68723.1 hypothetical protein DUE52_14670 [Larkinella punicea]
MLNNRHLFAAVFVGGSCLAGCKNDDDFVTCKPVANITPQNTCYEPVGGLTLVASGQTTSPDRSQFTWSVFPQSDTSMNSNIAVLREKILVGNETIIIPDSILKNSPKFVVKVKTLGCGAGELHSIYYSFVKRQVSESTNCFVWQRQNI